MGKFAPEALTSWTVSRLPRPARLWVNMYGHRAVLESFPGSKLYLLLQQELENSGSHRSGLVRQSLIPSRLPPPVIRASPNELSLRNSDGIVCKSTSSRAACVFISSKEFALCGS